jgi:type I restriction enzyme S subunit
MSRDADVGKCAVIGTEMAISQHFLAWECSAKGLLHNYYLYYWLQNRKAEFERVAVGSTIKTIGLPYFKKLRISFPEILEQRKIAEMFRTWDHAIDATNRLIAAKQARLTAIRQRLLVACRPGARPEISDAWEETTLGNLFVEVSDRNPGLGPESVITVGKYAIRPQAEHFTRSVASANLGNYQLLNPGDFVYDPMSAYYGAIGRYTGTLPGLVSPAYTVVRLVDGINPSFVEALLKSHYITFELENRSSQGNREGKRRILRSDEFSSISFMMPPRQEQDRIAHIISEAARELHLTKQSRDALSKQKRGLMQKLLTGTWPLIRENDDG